jgi:hypothetical protein
LGEGEFIVRDGAVVFVDYAAGDYRLNPTGPAVDMGLPVADHLPTRLFSDFDFTRDFAGARRVFGPRIDVGPYEAEYPEGALAGRKPIPTGDAAMAAAAGPGFTRIAGREPIVIPALSFTAEGGGKVTPITRSSCGFNSIVRYWNAEGHYLEYTVDAPAAGDYDVAIRYTCQFPAPRQVLVGGKAVPGLQKVTLPATGGWKHFKESTLPAKVPLAKGRNTIRLVSLGGQGCNVDRLTLRGPNDAAVVVSAGEFTDQGGGKVEVVPSPRHGLFARWNAKGHWLEWTADVPQAGRYELRIRYATLANSPRQFSVNGRAVEGLESILLPRTNGWRRCNEVSLPVALDLKHGRNLIRVTSVGGAGMNFDELRLIAVE